MDNKYKNRLAQCAAKCDSLMEQDGYIPALTSRIINCNDENATLELLKVISDAAGRQNLRLTKSLQELKDSLIEYYGYMKIIGICRQKELPDEDQMDAYSLDELLEELDKLVGLKKVKETISDLISYQRVLKMRENAGLHEEKSTLHLAFTGNPGTGKTTVARIVGRIYKEIGLLSRGHFIEVSRTDLIAGYQGQTALKVKDVIERAKGGVLFIDEAYSITENDHSDSYGRECLTELTKALEDYRDDLVVIVAGYTEPMEHFFDSNPGLRSRFNTFIEFDDYSASELKEMLQLICKRNDYTISDDAMPILSSIIDMAVAGKDDLFANGRYIRNLYEKLTMNHAKRIVHMPAPTKEQLMEITAADASLDFS